MRRHSRQLLDRSCSRSLTGRSVGGRLMGQEGLRLTDFVKCHSSPILRRGTPVSRAARCVEFLSTSRPCRKLCGLSYLVHLLLHIRFPRRVHHFGGGCGGRPRSDAVPKDDITFALEKMNLAQACQRCASYARRQLMGFRLPAVTSEKTRVGVQRT